jgi:hypothetical protein
MKLKFKTEGLEGDNLRFVCSLNETLEKMDDFSTASDVQKALNEKFKDVMGEDGKFKVVMKDEFNALTDEENPNSLKSIIKAQGAKIKALEETPSKGAETKTLQEVLGAHVEDFKNQVKNRQGTMSWEIKEFMENGKKNAAVIAVGTGGSVTNSVSAATGLRLGDGPIFEIKRGTPFILDFVNLGETSQPYLIWWDEQAKQGDFAITSEGTTKPMVQYEFIRKSADYRKEAGFMTLTEEFMNDLPQLVTTIKRLANIDLMNNINAAILTDMIATLPSYTYTALSGKIYHADDYAAIGAAIAQIQSLFFQPNVLVLNPADAWKMKLTKDDVGRYQMPPFSNGLDVPFEFGTVIVDPRIAVGKFLIGDGSTYNVDMKGGVVIRIGYNGTDFVQNQQTVVVEQYFFNYIATNRLGAWVYGTFATIKGIINDETNS